jgi:DNA-binding Lrp family transcriptional regulator
MDEIDSKILLETNKGLLLTPEPFNEIAVQLGIPQKEVIARLVKLRESGVIRRFGALIKPNDLGFSANALVAWRVPENRVQEVGSRLAKISEVTHCYERVTVDGKWEYNLYTVLHARERGTLEQFVKYLSEANAVNDYLILYSTRDLKRTCARSSSAFSEVSTKNVLGDRNV